MFTMVIVMVKMVLQSALPQSKAELYTRATSPACKQLCTASASGSG